MIHRCAIDLGASRRGRRSQEDPTPARQVNTPTQSSKHTNREREMVEMQRRTGGP